MGKKYAEIPTNYLPITLGPVRMQKQKYNKIDQRKKKFKQCSTK